MANTATSVVQQRNSDMVELLKPDFMTRQELTYTATLSEYQTLPCLRFLGAGGLGSAGEWRDLSGNGMHLSYNGNPTMSYTTRGAPYWVYDGTGDYHSHADDANFDITGTETTVLTSQRGLTCGAWVYLNSLTPVTNSIIAKFSLSGGNYLSYILTELGTYLYFMITTDGSTLKSVTGLDAGGAGLTTGKWYFTAGRFIPSTAIKCWVNATETQNATSIPASIFSGAAPFTIGYDPANNSYTSGVVSLPFVCACALSDVQITRLYNRSRGLFGV